MIATACRTTLLLCSAVTMNTGALFPRNLPSSAMAQAPSIPERHMAEERVDSYFSADIETDGPIPGPYSILSFAIVFAGKFDGREFERPSSYERHFYAELRPISNSFDPEALRINGIDRVRLLHSGKDPTSTMTNASKWVRDIAGPTQPVLVAYPLSFDWSWLYWYFIQFSRHGSPFEHSRCFDIKTAFAVKARVPISEAGRANMPGFLRSARQHSHHALDDAIEQAEIFANVFDWKGLDGRPT